MKSKYFLSTILLLVGLILGFVGGYFNKNYQNAKFRENFRSGNTPAGQRFVPNGNMEQNRGGMVLGGSIEGEIISIDDKSVTIKISDGSTKIILFSDSTSYLINSPSKKENLKSGVKVSVFGKTNSDGSLTADRIQLNSTN